MALSRSSDRPRLISHRGWNSLFPENSLPALAAAVNGGAHEIEFDVRMSRDKVPCICHDETVDRVSNLTGLCSEWDMETLRSAHLRMPDGTLVPGLGFPTLDDVMILFGGRVVMNVHVKELDRDHRVLYHLRDWARGGAPPDMYIAGDPTILQAASQVCPEIPRCLLVGPAVGSRWAELARDLHCTRVQFSRTVFRIEDALRAREAGLIGQLFWSDDPVEAAQLIRQGLVGILTNDLGPLMVHLQKEGLVAPTRLERS